MRGKVDKPCFTLQKKKQKKKQPVFIFTTPVNRTPLEGMKYNNLHQP